MASHDDTRIRHVGPPALGSALLTAGVVLLCLRGLHDAAGLPFAMPRFWYANGIFWYAVAAALIAGGVFMLRERPYVETGWRPTLRGRRFRSVVLYTRPGCHLCDDAKAVLSRYSQWLPTAEERNIETDGALVERYGNCVPVVEIDGRVRFRGRINEVLLRRQIEATPPLDMRSGGRGV